MPSGLPSVLAKRRVMVAFSMPVVLCGCAFDVVLAYVGYARLSSLVTHRMRLLSGPVLRGSLAGCCSSELADFYLSRASLWHLPRASDIFASICVWCKVGARTLQVFFYFRTCPVKARLGVAVWPAYRPQPAEHALLAVQVCQHVQEDGSVRCDLVDLVEVACLLRVVWPCGAVGGVCERTLLSSVFRFSAP